MKRWMIGFAAVVVLAAVGQATASITVHTSDFINDLTRTHFNGFENIPNDGANYTGGSGPYVEDGIQVQQVNGYPGNGIWVTYTGWGPEGNYSWYPNGGDLGYTRITLADGSDFQNIGFLRGSGWSLGPTTTLLYELYDDGLLVLAGSVANPYTASYLGFSGGGFDEIIMQGPYLGGGSVTDGSLQALCIDSIETSGEYVIPEPSTIIIWSLLGGLGIMVGWYRRRKAA